jgi:hypothetical protein
VTGFQAEMLVECEIRGIPAAEIVAIVDSHYVTAEIIEAFNPVMEEVAGVRVENVHKMKAFRDVLKEVNARDNNIFN